MKSFWLFRSNLRQLEPYHICTNLKNFEENCHDFYILQVIWFLKNNVFNEGIIWRLRPKEPVKDIVFDINGKKLIQKFVSNFSECFRYPKPYVSFWRGGFFEYDNVVNQNPLFFGLKLYLGAGRRVKPQFGGHYDKILVESNSDLFSKNCIPFYKTANPNIFKPLNESKKYDLVWVCNFSQFKYKGQNFFIDQVSKSSYLRSLKILHIGNKRSFGVDLCKKNNVENIQFVGYLSRSEVNRYLNKSRLGVVTSSLVDGCPRVSTEIMAAGVPLLLREQTRLLDYYTKAGSVVLFRDDELEQVVKLSLGDYEILKKKAMENIGLLSLDKICTKNLDLWFTRN